MQKKVPTNIFEKKAYALGYKFIAGIDEVGRGSWAGPVVAGAVILPAKARLPGLADSKMLPEKQRERLYPLIIEQAVAWAVGIIEVDVIDAVGIGLANRRAMEQAVKNLPVQPDFLLIDAVKLRSAGLPFEAIIKGDAKVRSIAAASIVAKVTRDRMMQELDSKYPGYGFGEHKGYGTPGHQQKIAELGICPMHRRSFLPINLERQIKLI